MVASHGPQGVGLARPARAAVHHDGGPAAVVVALAGFESAEVAGARQPLGAVLAHGHQLPVPDGLPVVCSISTSDLATRRSRMSTTWSGSRSPNPQTDSTASRSSCREGGQPSPQLPSASSTPSSSRSARAASAAAAAPPGLRRVHELPVQAVEDLRYRQAAEPGGGQLDGERNAAPVRASGSRLVASTCTPGLLRASASATRRATVASRCSQLSRN